MVKWSEEAASSGATLASKDTSSEKVGESWSALDISVTSPPHNYPEASQETIQTEAIQQIVELFGGTSWDGSEGTVYQVHVSPMTIEVSARNLSKVRTDSDPVIRAEHNPREELLWITRRSINRMVKSLSELDYTPMDTNGGRKGLLTLTFPPGWEEVVPDGITANRMVDQFLRKAERSFGVEIPGIWKRETTDQGVPHFHLYLRIPEGVAGQAARMDYEERLREWESSGRTSGKPRRRKAHFEGLSIGMWAPKAWASIVNVSNPIARAAHEVRGAELVEVDEEGTPARMIAYFSNGRYSGKGYQNRHPEAWKGRSKGHHYGTHLLESAKRSVQLSRREFVLLSRVLEKMKRNVRRRNHVTRLIGVVRSRRSTTSHTGAGYVLTKSGPDLGGRLYDYLVTRTAPETPPERLPVGLRGPITTRLPDTRLRGNKHPELGDLRASFDYAGSETISSEGLTFENMFALSS